MSSDDLDTLKRKFAYALLRNTNAFLAAQSVILDVGLALQAANDWIRDPIVVEEMERLMSETPEGGFLPTKEMTARQVYVIATEQARTTEDKLKSFRLFAEIMGYITTKGQGAGGGGLEGMPAFEVGVYDDLKGELKNELDDMEAKQNVG